MQNIYTKRWLPRFTMVTAKCFPAGKGENGKGGAEGKMYDGMRVLDDESGKKRYGGRGGALELGKV